MINKQSGMSQGLRFLFDRNSHHLAVSIGLGNFLLLERTNDPSLGDLLHWLEPTDIDADHDNRLSCPHVSVASHAFVSNF